MSPPGHAIVLDLDGTLVDSVYQHVLAWDQAFKAHGHAVALTDIHTAIGMGSDRLVPHLLGRCPEEAEELADHHLRVFLDAADGLLPTRGALELLDDLNRRGVPHLVATSASGQEADALLAALGADPPRVDSTAVGESKPAPALFEAACEELGYPPERSIVVGDSPWDAEAATRMGASSLCVRCGGFSDLSLRVRGARVVVDDPLHLIGQL